MISGGLAEHLLQNAYNALYHNEFYCCDWDMFWTKHEDCVKHSLLRAVSGGPVYFSDKIGETDPEVLKPLAYLDGRILMMERLPVYGSYEIRGIEAGQCGGPWTREKGRWDLSL